MSTRTLLLIFAALHGFSAAALTRFPSGVCTLEGYVFKDKHSSDEYFVVNHRTGAETRFKLSGYAQGALKNYERLPVRMQVKFNQPTFSAYGDAEFGKIETVLDPTVEPLLYNNEAEVMAHCNRREPSGRAKRKTR